MTRVNEAAAIISALRSGLVPKEGLQHFATGLSALQAAVDSELDFVATGKGSAKWLRGEYGTGKTFAARYLCARARARGFATAEVQISINDTPLHYLETVYRRLLEKLETAAHGSAALRSVVDGWLFQLGEEVTRLQGLTEDDPGFAEATEERLKSRLADLSKRSGAFAAALRGYHAALNAGELETAQGLLSWLAAQPFTDRAILKKAGLKGAVDGAAALTFLGGILQVLRQSGFAGLVVVLDEVETIQRMNAQTREKSLNVLRQLMDSLAKEELPGLYLVITGTRDFFEGHKGLRGLPALHQRVYVKFDEDSTFENLRAPQVRLAPFTQERLLEVGQRVRDLYPAQHAERVAARVSDAFLRALVAQVTTGLGGKVAVAPRLFLRELVDVLDRVDQHAGYDPAQAYKLVLDEALLNPEELAAKRGQPVVEAPEVPEEDDAAAPVAVESAAVEPTEATTGAKARKPTAKRARRVEG